MQVKSFVFTMGLGMAAGAAAAMVLPKSTKMKKAVNKATGAVENAMEQTRAYMGK